MLGNSLILQEMHMYKQWVRTKDVQWLQKIGVDNFMGLEMWSIQEGLVHEFIHNVIVYNKEMI